MTPFEVWGPQNGSNAFVVAIWLIVVLVVVSLSAAW
jgi:hypothetical protein